MAKTRLCFGFPKASVPPDGNLPRRPLRRRACVTLDLLRHNQNAQASDSRSRAVSLWRALYCSGCRTRGSGRAEVGGAAVTAATTGSPALPRGKKRWALGPWIFPKPAVPSVCEHFGASAMAAPVAFPGGLPRVSGAAELL